MSGFGMQWLQQKGRSARGRWDVGRAMGGTGQGNARDATRQGLTSVSGVAWQQQKQANAQSLTFCGLACGLQRFSHSAPHFPTLPHSAASSLQDLGVIDLLRRVAPNLPVHGSTQVGVWDGTGRWTGGQGCAQEGQLLRPAAWHRQGSKGAQVAGPRGGTLGRKCQMRTGCAAGNIHPTFAASWCCGSTNKLPCLNALRC